MNCRAGLGTALTVAFLVQVTPSVWTAYRADHTTGIATGTWLLIFGELLCWGVFGICESDPVTASARAGCRCWARRSGDRAQRAVVDIARADERLLVPPSRRIPVPCAAPVADR